MLGKLRAALKQYDKATEALEKMLAEGAGLYQDEALNLCAGYYAVNKQYNEAAAKLNILSRRKNSRFAEQAAYKLCMLWLKAESLDLAVIAIGDLSTRFPRNKQAKSLMFQVADLFRRKRMFRQAVAACDQLRRRFPKSPSTSHMRTR